VFFNCRRSWLFAYWTWLDLASIGIMWYLTLSALLCIEMDSALHWELKRLAAVEVLILFLRSLYFSFAIDWLGSFVRTVILVGVSRVLLSLYTGQLACNKRAHYAQQQLKHGQEMQRGSE
jgi:hypothetical protein